MCGQNALDNGIDFRFLILVIVLTLGKVGKLGGGEKPHEGVLDVFPVVGEIHVSACGDYSCGGGDPYA